QKATLDCASDAHRSAAAINVGAIAGKSRTIYCAGAVTAGGAVKPTRPTRMSCDHWGLSSAAIPAALMWAWALSAGSGNPPVTSRPCSYSISSILPFSRTRQSHTVLLPWACDADTSMLVVQLLVTALYHSGWRCNSLTRLR